MLKVFDLIGRRISLLGWVFALPYKLFRWKAGRNWYNEKYNRAFDGMLVLQSIWSILSLLALLFIVSGL